MDTRATLRALEASYDAVPRPEARAERVGPLELFVRDGPGWPYYARPALGAQEITAADVEAVLARQRELGVPEAVEWVCETTPSAERACRDAGLDVELCPLLVLDGPPPDPTVPPEFTVALLSSRDEDLMSAEAVAGVAFGAGIGTRVGDAGPVEREAARLRTEQEDPDRAAAVRALLASGRSLRAVARSASDGPLAVGALQHALGVGEVVGVATLPSARRRGLAAAVTALLAREALGSGLTTVFLSAQDDDVARVYERVGFVRVGTAGLAAAPT